MCALRHIRPHHADHARCESGQGWQLRGIWAGMVTLVLCNAALDAALLLSSRSPIAAEAGAVPISVDTHALKQPAAGEVDTHGGHGAGKARH